jgi:hypothetical protein
MKSALGFEARDGHPRGTPFAPLRSGYFMFSKLRSTGRAKLFVALPRIAWSVEPVVVIKRMHPP